MSITISGMYIWSLPQVDGTTVVREGFTDNQGNSYPPIDYVAPVGYNIDERLLNDTTNLQNQVNQEEGQE
jgi:hypothetical protein